MKTKKVVNADGLPAFPTSAVAQLFWPLQAWKSSGLVVVLDDDSIDDHVTGTILSNLQLVTHIRVRYETKPPENTTCGNWRREGYSRQQYSNFYADLYTDAEFAAIVDSDALFTAPGEPAYCLPAITKRSVEVSVLPKDRT